VLGVLVARLGRDEARRRRHPRYHPACRSLAGRGRFVGAVSGPPVRFYWRERGRGRLSRPSFFRMLPGDTPRERAGS